MALQCSRASIAVVTIVVAATAALIARTIGGWQSASPSPPDPRPAWVRPFVPATDAAVTDDGHAEDARLANCSFWADLAPALRRYSGVRPGVGVGGSPLEVGVRPRCGPAAPAA